MPPVPFQILSDLHLETHPSYSNFTFRQKAPYLALVGDIGLVSDPHLFTFLEHQLSRFWIVFFVLGNHEPTNLGTSSPLSSSSNSRARTIMQDFASRMASLHASSTLGRFVLLDQTRFDIRSDLTILGCTLFSHVSPGQQSAVSSRLIDFRSPSTSNWDVPAHNAAHAADLAWLNEQVSRIEQHEPHRRILIFTHHAPLLDDLRITDPKHVGSEVSSAFGSDLRREACWVSSAVRAWVFGHTHFNCDFVDGGGDGGAGGKRVLTNQKGYFRFPAQGFEGEKVFELG